MKHRKDKHENADRLIADADQENFIWPPPFSSGQNTKESFWKGYAKPPIIQRIAAWLIGLWLIGLALGFFYIAVREEQGSLSRAVFGTFTIGSGLVGVKIFRNGFPRHSKGAE
jgi:hypothetical protein